MNIIQKITNEPVALGLLMISLGAIIIGVALLCTMFIVKLLPILNTPPGVFCSALISLGLFTIFAVFLLAKFSKDN